ncbi:hypothetical protein JZO83_00815 [Enterococcus sp. DIV1298c]|uniref:hypothetical protein n=1 Tax=Enterococcus sp. DIV1298c TaxID=2815328 RepID=UPI001A92EFE6|nr:hypothetical protein [Enterococcus sp. DIV1298c]MBO0460285.1 hypothetical protein [Enterococcus sp. DIV1298c]
MNVNRQQQDKLAKEKRMLKNQLFQLEKVLQKGCRQLSDSNHKGIQRGMSNAI